MEEQGREEVDMMRRCRAEAYRKHLLKYIRNGHDGDLIESGSDPDGGFRMADALTDSINSAILDLSPLRRLASVARITTEALMVSPGRVIPVHELYVQPKTTQKDLDHIVDLEGWLVEKAAEVFARIERESLLNGTGVGQPHGILTRAKDGTIEIIESSGAISAECILHLLHSLGDDYAATASFIMNRSTVQAVRMLQDSTGGYLWQPSLSADQPDRLAGAPVHLVAEMPDAVPGALAIAVGDFRDGYQIVDREGIRILRDPFTDKPFVKFYTTKRVGGDVQDDDAIKVLRMAA